MITNVLPYMLMKMQHSKVLADLDTIVFEGREQNYGAFQLRKNYERMLSRATLIALLSFVSLTGLPKVMAWMSPVNEEKFIEAGPTVLLPPIEHPKEAEEPEPEPDIPEPAAPPLPPVRTIAFLIPVPTPDDEIKDDPTIADITELDSAAIGLVDLEGDPGAGSNYNFDDLIGDGDGEPKNELEGGFRETPPDSFVLLDKEPKPVNMDELKKLIGYPKMAVEAEIEGKVVVRVYIDKYGNYNRHIVLKDPHPLLTQAVASKIANLKMTPGIQGAKPIPVWVTLPFEFTLMKK
jgi:periplasmic protein TonB